MAVNTVNKKFEAIAQHENLPSMSSRDVECLAKIYGKGVLELDKTYGSDPADFKGRAEEIKEIDARLANGNRWKKALSLIITALIVGVIAAGSVLEATSGASQLSPHLILWGSLAFLSTTFIIPPDHQHFEHHLQKQDCKEIGKVFLKILAGPLYPLYLAFNYEKDYNPKVMEKKKAQLIEDMEKVQAKLPKKIDRQRINDKASDTIKAGLYPARMINARAEDLKATLKQVDRLHEVMEKSTQE